MKNIRNSISRLGLIASALLASNAFAKPTGLDPAGQLVLTEKLASAKSNAFAFDELENGVQVRLGETVKNVLFYSPNIVRVNANLGKLYTKVPSLTVVLPPPKMAFRIKDSAISLELSTASLRVIVDKKSGALTFLHSDGTEITRERAEQPTVLKKVTISDTPTYEVKQTFTLAPDESLYGLGQYNQRYMDYRGQEVLLVQTNIGIVVPLLISTKRYGIMWDIYSKSIFKDDQKGASFWAESAPAGVDYYFIEGADMDGVIAGYRQLTGAAPMFPRSAFGLWMSKERYKTQEQLIDVVKRFRQEGIPLDNIVQDWQYWGSAKDGSWSGMIWDKERYPDPMALTNTLHELHVKLMNSIWPSVGDDTELAHELDAKGLRFAPLHWISKKARIYDAYSPEGRVIYFKHIKEGLLDVGVDYLWMDGTEVEVGSACHDPHRVEVDIKSLGKNALGDFTRYLNTYSLETTKGTYEGQRATSNKRVLTLTRSSFTGQQRYAALPWSGDTTATWDIFRNQISGGVNVAMAGHPYWTQDTGGFFVSGKWRGAEKNPAYRELFARWHQFGAFNPIYRIHGTDAERELYVFKDLDPEVYKSLIDCNHLRYRLVPYVYGMAWMSTNVGYTMMRGLPMDFPDDLAARKLDDEFLFGSFLVHPVTRAMYRGATPATTIPASAFTTPEGTPGISVEYFEGTNFERKTGTVVDQKVDYTWPGPPLTDLPPGLKSSERFSARLTGTITFPEDGEYEIGGEADDGFRLWLDDKLVVEDWPDMKERYNHPALYKSQTLTFKKNQKVAVKIEYCQGRGDRVLRLGWNKLGDPNTKDTFDNTVKTYLPAGANWYDFWTNEQLTGGKTVSKACPLNIMPLYVRAGTIIPMSPVMQYVSEKPEAPYEIRIYTGADAKFVIYEDDNETYDYEKGQRATIELLWNDAARTLTVGERKGTFPGMIAQRQLRVILAAPGQAQGATEVKDGGQVVHYTGKAVSVKF